MISGRPGDIAMKVYGDDLDAMGKSAQQIASVLKTVKGAADVKVEQTAGFPGLDVQFGRGEIAGMGCEGDRRYDIVVRLDNLTRNDLDAVGALPVMLPGEDVDRVSVPLREVA